MQKIMVYSESGGAGKTTTSVSFAMSAALAGKRTLLIDLDPRGASTKWLGVKPVGEGLHIGSILGNDDSEGWAESIAVPTAWHENLRMIPSSRAVSTLEGLQQPHSELRLLTSLEGLEGDVVVIDCPNRQGGLLTLSALNAADTVVYAATATEDGLDGVIGAQNSVNHFRAARRKIGAVAHLTEAGIIACAVADTIQSRIERESLDALADQGSLLTPFVPSRAIVKEMRVTHEWFGKYRKGQKVADAYAELAGKVIR